MSMSMSSGDGGGAVGVYGKVTSQPDFLRANAGEFSQAGLDRWFQEAMEVVRNDKTALPTEPTAFLLAPSESRQAFVGAFTPSTDAAGRMFPLAVFAEVSGADVTESLPAVAQAYAAFAGAAGALAAASVDLPGADLVAHAQALTPYLPPSGGGFASDGVVSAALAQEAAHPLVVALGGTAAGLGYALRTFCMACDQAAKTGPAGRGAITVDAPAPNEASRALWTELARRRLKWRDAAPSLLWTSGEGGRLLLTLGQPSTSAFGYLANPRHRSPRFWPLRTDVVVAIDQAMKALTPEQKRRVENPRVSLGELLSSFSG